MSDWVKEKEVRKIQALESKCLRWITPKAAAVLFTVIYAASVVPLLWIGCYNYPSADDYSIGSNAHAAWMATHNIFAVIWAGILRSVEDWMTWMGYFTSNYLMAVPPSSFGEKWYFLTAVIMIGMLTASTAYLLYGIFVKCCRFDKYLSFSVIMLMLFASVQCLCPAGRVEAFYWYSGAANYILVHSLANFYLGLLIRIAFHTGKRRTADIAAASVLGFLVGGGNQMTALNVAVVLFFAAILITYHKKWKDARPWIAPSALNLLGFILNVAAPGNWVRAGISHGMNPVKAVLISFYDCLDRCVNQWTTWTVLLLFFMIGLIAFKMTAGSDFKFQYPALVVALAFCLTSAMMTPPLFAVGNIEAGRLLALSYIMYILQATIAICYVAGWARYRYDHRVQNEKQDGEKTAFSFSYRWAVLGAVLCLFGGSLLTIIPEPHAYTYSSAMTDLLNGSAKAYYLAQCERTALYYSGQEGVLEVEPLPAEPVLLYFSDITPDKDDWQNAGLARYLGIEGVVKTEKGGRK